MALVCLYMPFAWDLPRICKGVRRDFAGTSQGLRTDFTGTLQGLYRECAGTLEDFTGTVKVLKKGIRSCKCGKSYGIAL